MRILRTLMSNVSIGKLVDQYSRFSPSPLSMKQFLDFGEFFIDKFSRKDHFNKYSVLTKVLGHILE